MCHLEASLAATPCRAVGEVDEELASLSTPAWRVDSASPIYCYACMPPYPNNRTGEGDDRTRACTSALRGYINPNPRPPGFHT
jgi:hypothetical protein